MRSSTRLRRQTRKICECVDPHWYGRRSGERGYIVVHGRDRRDGRTRVPLPSSLSPLSAVLCIPFLCFPLLSFAFLCFALLCIPFLSFPFLCFPLLCFALLCFARLGLSLLCGTRSCSLLVRIPISVSVSLFSHATPNPGCVRFEEKGKSRRRGSSSSQTASGAVRYACSSTCRHCRSAGGKMSTRLDSSTRCLWSRARACGGCGKWTRFRR